MHVYRDSKRQERTRMAQSCPELHPFVSNWILIIISLKLTRQRWFSVNMGTGIVSILLHNLPYNAVWLYWLSVVIFCLNVVLFTIFLCLSIARYTIYPEIWPAMIRHPAQSLFLGTFPMGLATIINMTVFVCVPSWGYRAVQLVGYYYP